MQFQTITTFLHDPGATLNTLDWAIDAARAWDAHLQIICTGIDTTDPGFYYVGAQAVAIQQNMELAQARAAELETLVENRMAREDVAWEVETFTLAPSGLPAFLANHMRFSDLAILPRPYGPNASRMDVHALEACLFSTRIPVLVIPDDVTFAPVERIMLAWNDTPEALAACRAALPLISQAASTDVTIIDPLKHGPERSDPGGRLAQYLVRHGGRVDISVQSKTTNSIADLLTQAAREKGCNIVAMGAYGHSRFREAVLGGATRDMLETAPLPVLMAH